MEILVKDSLMEGFMQQDNGKGACKAVDDEPLDDTASTCAPPSVACSSVDSLCTPDLGPLDSPFSDTDSVFALLPDKDAQVCIVHHDEMQLHAPPRAAGIFELPRRVMAIENCLKGLETDRGFPKRNWGNAKMQFLRASHGKRKHLVVAFGSAAAKKQRTSQHTGPASAGSLWEACRTVEAPIVQDTDLRLVHTKKHIDQVTELCRLAETSASSFFPLERSFAREPKTSKGILNDDVYYCPNSLAAMKRAAGGAVEAVRQLFSIDPRTGRAIGRSDTQSSFAIVRPPGHHCCSDPNGFCFFNNTAVAASHARKVLGLSRVAIIDWDYHHGDGQQTLFYADPNVLTISLHVAMERNKKGKDEIAFPANRSMDFICTGAGPGLGYNINIPWPHDKVGAADYQDAFDTIVLPALHGFDPELILVASGFDAVQGDMLAGTRLPPSSYYDMTRLLLSIGKPVAVVLEGGYSPDLLAKGSSNVIHALLGRAPPRSEADSGTSSAEEESSGNPEAQGVLDAVRCQLNTLPPWTALRTSGDTKYFKEEDLSSLPSVGVEAASRLSGLIQEQAQKD